MEEHRRADALQTAIVVRELLTRGATEGQLMKVVNKLVMIFAEAEVRIEPDRVLYWADFIYRHADSMTFREDLKSALFLNQPSSAQVSLGVSSVAG